MSKSVKAKDLRGTAPEELNRTLAKLQNDLFQHKLKRSTNQLENTMLIRNARRDIARINTVLTELGASGQALPAANANADTAIDTAEEK